MTRIFTVESAKTDTECCAPQSIILHFFFFFCLEYMPLVLGIIYVIRDGKSPFWIIVGHDFQKKHLSDSKTKL